MVLLSSMASHKKYCFILLAILSFTPLIGTIGAQYLLDMAPCNMCILERWPYAAGLVFSLFALLNPQHSKFMLVLILLSFFVGIGLSGYHLMIEHGMASGSQACGGEAMNFKGESIEELETFINSTPARRCDQVPKLFGLVSFATLNLIYSAVLSFYCLVTLRTMKKKKFI